MSVFAGTAGEAAVLVQPQVLVQLQSQTCPVQSICEPDSLRSLPVNCNSSEASCSALRVSGAQWRSPGAMLLAPGTICWSTNAASATAAVKPTSFRTLQALQPSVSNKPYRMQAVSTQHNLTER